jgi:uncharacterized protein
MWPQRIRACLVLMVCTALVAAWLAMDAPPSRLFAQGEPAPKKKADKVKAEAHLSVDKLPPGGECQVLIRLSIEPGWHINTNPAKPKDFIPTEITITGKQGTRLAEVTFPKGKPIRMQDFDEQVWVYDGKVDIRGKLRVPATAAGKTEDIDIVVRYQACDDQRCLLPATYKLNGRLPVAATLAEVKPINAKLFEPETP